MPYDVRPLERSFGLETELAIRFDRNESHGGKTADCLEIYEQICHRLVQHSSAAPAPETTGKQGIYFANGSAIWFERQWLGIKEGLIEVCTPECKDPVELAASHAAMDQLVSSAAAELPGDVGLLKNCVDPRGISYGAQENYEVVGYDDDEAEAWLKGIRWPVVASSLGVSFVLLAPLMMLWMLYRTIKVVSSVTVALPAIVLVMLIGYLLLCVRRGRWLAPHMVFVSMVAIALAPKSFLLSRFYHRMKIGRTYEKLKPFLISRVVWSGSGGLDPRGEFFLGQKAKSRDTDWLVVFCDSQKAIFCFNYLFKEICRQSTGPRKALGSQRQRLSLSIGDSNMSQEVNWLKVATTCLVLDAIEAGAIRDTPELAKPLRALKKINQDPSLEKTVRTSRGEMTGIEIQQFYLNACRQYVESFEDPPQQALDVLKCWSEYLIKLKTDRESLVGRVDWITKRQVMRAVVEQCDHQCAESALGAAKEFADFPNRAALQKADLKFHELGAAGYNQQLVDGGAVESFLNESELDRASRMPPTVATAAQRCRYIREFGPEIEWITWDEVKLSGQNVRSLASETND